MAAPTQSSILLDYLVQNQYFHIRHGSQERVVGQEIFRARFDGGRQLYRVGCAQVKVSTEAGGFFGNLPSYRNTCKMVGVEKGLGGIGQLIRQRLGEMVVLTLQEV